MIVSSYLQFTLLLDKNIFTKNVFSPRHVRLLFSALPMWTNQTESVVATEGETVVIDCRADARPEPYYCLSINGLPLGILCVHFLLLSPKYMY